jgi:hypothetical protein
MPRYTSRSSRCQWYVWSATLKNLNPSATSTKPRMTFTVLSQPPLFGRFFSIDGNKAKSANGNANVQA